ncbi:MAG: hypothetical protein EOO01_28480 [Chitinophagaceae bacterium]|nr:MAG: hypothetical protein EOO01_28480 [Chitinophagaceae bacterium]
MNRQLPPPNFNKARNFPHLAVSRLPLETILDTLTLKGVDVAYTEFSEQTLKRGTIKLDNLRGKILNVTNDSLQLTKRSHALADLYASVMGAGKLNMKIDFHLQDPQGRFDYKGNIGAMDLKILNPLATNLGLVAIESGRVRRIDFAATGNRNGANGTLTMLYDDLIIELLKKEEGKIKQKGFLSFLANNVLVINNNPRKAGDPVRTGKIEFVRPMTSSFFNLLWKSIFTGIRETVGIGVVPMKKPPSPKKVKK